jgi:glycosyltransferase involved in cell wall biosynthesis
VEEALKVVYISEGNLPSKEANSIQVAKMAQALAQKVDYFELVTLGDLWSLVTGNKFDFQQWYGLTRAFKITQLPLLCKAEYPFPRKYRNEYRCQHFARWSAFYTALKFPDLVYTRSRNAAKIALKLGLAVLWEWHMPIIKGEHFRHQAFTSSKFLGVITISKQLAREYIEAGLPAEKVWVEHDGVDLERFVPYQSKEEARRRLALPIDAPTVVYVGHLYDFKGIPTLYDVARMMPHCQFKLIGGWQHDVERARHFCQNNGISNVQVIGHVPQFEVPTYLYASDVLVLPNSGKHVWSETTSPLKLFEYMVARRPIVASALSNISTVLQDKSNALLAEPDCPLSFKLAIEKLLREPQLGQALADRAFKDVKYYTWEHRAERILKFATGRLQTDRLQATSLIGDVRIHG